MSNFPAGVAQWFESTANDHGIDYRAPWFTYNSRQVFHMCTSLTKPYNLVLA